MSKREILFLLDDMLQSGLKIKRYTKDLDFNSFSSDDRPLMQLFGTLRSLEQLQIGSTQILRPSTQRLNGKEYVDFVTA